MTIRIATVADAAALAELARETFVDAFGADNRPEDIAAYVDEVFGEVQQRRELADPDVVTLVADDIAYAQLRRTGPREVELARFYVRRAHHGKGVAQQLMATVVNAARALGGTTLWLGVW